MAAVVWMIDHCTMERAELVQSIAVQASSLLAELSALRSEGEALRRELDAWTPLRDAGEDEDDRPTIPVRDVDTVPCCA